jgi:hypothetical protein
MGLSWFLLPLNDMAAKENKATRIGYSASEYKAAK